MKIGNYKLEQTNDGTGIYLNGYLVDDKISAKTYWKGWDEWVRVLSINDSYDIIARIEIINEERFRNKN